MLERMADGTEGGRSPTRKRCTEMARAGYASFSSIVRNELIGLYVDIAYTRAPHWIQMDADNVHEKGASFWSLARLAYPYDRQMSLRGDVLPSPLHGAVVNPDDHLLCYDYLYYVGGHQVGCLEFHSYFKPLTVLQWFEFDYEYGPAWRDVGRHLHWTEDIEDLAVQYVNRALGLPIGHSAPPVGLTLYDT